MICLLLVLFSALLLPNTGTANTAARIPGEFIIQLQPGCSADILEHDFAGIQAVKCLSPSLHIWLYQSVAASEPALEKIRSNRYVRLAQYNHLLSPRNLIPNDSLFSSQWNLLNTGQNGGVPGADISATKAFDLYTGPKSPTGDSLVIAIVDNTFDLNHPDLNYFINRSEIPGNGIDDDANGYIDDICGYDLFDNDADLNSTGPDANHSTHLAGVAGAKFQNTIGIAGVCPGVQILPVRYGANVESNVVAAYDYVLQMRALWNSSFGSRGALIVAENSSFGIDFARASDVPIWCAMYDSLGKAGVLSAGATANSNINVDEGGDIPSDCPSEYLIMATNTSRMDLRFPNSGYGTIGVDIGAPGTQINSTFPPSTYGQNSGTSFSTAHISGAIAHLYSRTCLPFFQDYLARPDSFCLDIKKAILRAADFNSSLHLRTFASARLNLSDAADMAAATYCNPCSFRFEVEAPHFGCPSQSFAASIRFHGTPPPAYTVNWGDGTTNSLPSHIYSSPGFYEVNVSSGGCSNSSAIKVLRADSVVINNISTIYNPGQSPRLLVSANAGNEELEFSLNGTDFQASGIFIINQPGTYTVFVRSSLGCVSQASTQITVATEEQEMENDFMIWPNPAETEIYLSLPETAMFSDKCRIYDMKGAYKEITVQNNIANVSSLMPGIYVIEMEFKQKWFRKRFIKK